MADHAAGEDIFVYTGGVAPQHVVNAIIDESVEEIDDNAFDDNPNCGLWCVMIEYGKLENGHFIAAFHCSV